MSTDRSRRAAMTLLGWEPIDWGRAGAVHEGKGVIVYLVEVKANRRHGKLLRAQHHFIAPGTSHHKRRLLNGLWLMSESTCAQLYDAVMEWETNEAKA